MECIVMITVPEPFWDLYRNKADPVGTVKLQPKACLTYLIGGGEGPGNNECLIKILLDSS
jgi:hypothetical protein